MREIIECPACYSDIAAEGTVGAVTETRCPECGAMLEIHCEWEVKLTAIETCDVPLTRKVN